ncbi:hypothetical protein ARHIZOSPH14_31270 [Agromyces rhizosphaerae]|uniref:Uncharacterized protein n=1 Tax=Agromyces rhizosphaerae TaxID=88374 RepID=A0A9W6CZ10_9MICO|nr:hypothetical protein [Agromyces rhizosphaerae]GLI28885.1 hypothetical protein ARHIZOSPH14_31270 [Agromyces rhizosphaerae]
MSAEFSRPTIAGRTAPASEVREDDAAPSVDEYDEQDEVTTTPKRSMPEWPTNLRFMVIVLAGVVALFLAFALLIAFNVSGEAISALAVISVPIATMVAAYYAVSLSMQQVDAAREAAAVAEERARAAEATARESDAWSAQMESGLRVAVAKLRGAGASTKDVERAAGTPDEFF